MANNVIFKFGTKTQYEAIESKDPYTLYWLTDEQKLYKGESLFGAGKPATAESDGLMSAADKEALDKLSAVTPIGTLTAVDGSLLITDGGDNEKQIKVQLSQNEGNLLTVESDGLLATAPTYAVEQKDEATEGFAVTYELKEKKETGDVVIGKIDIPKDKVVKTGELKFVATDDVPYVGAKKGDPYVELTIANDEETKIDIPVKGIVDTSDFVIGTVKGDNGTAYVFNEKDGGGIKFENTSGIKSFVGVHDGSTISTAEGLAGQLYAIDGSGLGTRLNLFKDKVTYISSAAQTAFKPALDSADYELAVKKDIADLEKKIAIASGALVWEEIGAVTLHDVQNAITETAEQLTEYATISVDGDKVKADIVNGEQDIDTAFGIKLAGLLAKSKGVVKAFYVTGHPEHKVDISSGVDLLNFADFVTDSGLAGSNKLKELNGKSLSLTIEDVNGGTYNFTVTFTFAG